MARRRVWPQWVAVAVVAVSLGGLIRKLAGDPIAHGSEPDDNRVAASIEGLGAMQAAADQAVLGACDSIESLIGSVVERSADEAGAGGVGDQGEVAKSAPAAPDSEWQAFPRLAFSIGAFLRRTHEVEGRLFYRHERLNPRDLPIHESERELLDEVLRSVTDKIGLLSQAHSSIALLEAQSLVANSSGRYPYVTPEVEGSPQADGTSVPMEFFKVHTGDVVLPRPEGGAYVVEERFLQGARLAREKRAFLSLEVGSALVAFFEARGILTRGESQVLLEEIVNEITRPSVAGGG